MKTEKKKSYGLMGLLIYLVIFIIYNLVVFLVFNHFNAVFWLSYCFMLTAFLIHIGCVVTSMKNMDVKAVFFGIPLISFSVFFVLAELFCSFVFMLFRKQASIKVTILIQAILLCIFIVVALVSVMSRNVVQDVNNNITQNVNFIKGINVDVEMLMQRSTNADVTGKLKQLSETIKYSDPMTNSIVATQEQMIMQYMAELRMAFDANDMERVKNLCDQIQLLFIERNKKLMISK